VEYIRYHGFPGKCWFLAVTLAQFLSRNLKLGQKEEKAIQFLEGEGVRYFESKVAVKQILYL
jgi:hypothetical protein